MNQCKMRLWWTSRSWILAAIDLKMNWREIRESQWLALLRLERAELHMYLWPATHHRWIYHLKQTRHDNCSGWWMLMSDGRIMNHLVHYQSLFLVPWHIIYMSCPSVLSSACPSRLLQLLGLCEPYKPIISTIIHPFVRGRYGSSTLQYDECFM